MQEIKNIHYAKQHHSPHCWLPAKVMYPANSTKRFSWLTHSTSILLMKNVQIYIYRERVPENYVLIKLIKKMLHFYDSVIICKNQHVELTLCYILFTIYIYVCMCVCGLRRMVLIYTQKILRMSSLVFSYDNSFYQPHASV